MTAGAEGEDRDAELRDAELRVGSGTITIRFATLDDASAIRSIYNVEVSNHTSTFDLVTRSLDDQRSWLAERSGAFGAVVATLADLSNAPDEGEMEVGEMVEGEMVSEMVVGFASLSPYKERAAYRTTVENSVYVSRDHAGAGIGSALMQHLIAMARDSGFHAMVARIEASSTASRALHTSCGFELVGVEREVGRKFNRWLDVAVMQLML